ncbi:MAG: single-stranded DNA-binding protein [Pyrinomonadaceae bacterium]
MASFAKIFLIGNLGRSPELRYTTNGTPVCDFSVAVNERKRDNSGEYHDTTQWYKVVIWRERAEIAAKYLQKGSPVYIEGRLSIEEWTDREGKTRHTLTVTASEMQFIGGRDDVNKQAESLPASDNNPLPAIGDAPDDDTPF